MKKILGMAFGILAASILSMSNAAADEFICGDITAIHSVHLWESNRVTDVPVDLTDLTVTFVTNNLQEYELPLNAFGTQLTVSLVKIFNFPNDLPLDTCLRVILAPLSFAIEHIEIGDRDLPLISP